MRIASSSFSNTGPRSSNQDRILLPFNQVGDQFIVAIADGIGGAEGGAEAAEIAINAVSKTVNSPADLVSVFQGVVVKLQEAARLNPNFSKMGTTLSVGLLRDRFLHVAHVGDARISHLRGLGLNTLTLDQTEVAELRRKGVLTEKQAKRYPRRNVLLSALNPTGDFEVFYNEVQLEIGDRLLFTTDGVHQCITRGSILNASIEHDSVAEFVSTIERRTSEAGPSDNFSAVGMQILEW
jgi:PPM family protein phosphatase